METRSKSFTGKYESRTNILISETRISQAFDPVNTTSRPPQILYNAIWDTGATHTAITRKVVQECNLQPIGIRQVHTCGGIRRCEEYLVNIVLRNNVGISELLVTETDIHGADVLIGMDIISQGDFAITQPNGKTVFSFRMPSIASIDFVDEFRRAQQQPVRHEEVRPGRNSPCPCGSGRKYKKCCGK